MAVGNVSPAISSATVLLIARTEATKCIVVPKLSSTAPMEGVLNLTYGVMERTTAETTVMKNNVQVGIQFTDNTYSKKPSSISHSFLLLLNWINVFSLHLQIAVKTNTDVVAMNVYKETSHVIISRTAQTTVMRQMDVSLLYINQNYNTRRVISNY